MKNKRRFRNILISPESQIEYSALFMAITVVVHAIVTVMGYGLYLSWASQGVAREGLSFWVLFAALIGVYLALYGFAFLLGLLVTHRLYGPLVAIGRQMQRLNGGDFSGRVRLREKDDPKMKELAAELNALSEKLELQSRRSS